MLDVFKEFAVDVKAEVEGVWRDFHGAEVLVARADNRKFNKAITQAYEQNKEKLVKKDAAADALADKLTLGVLADTIILDWKGIGYQGKELKYSRDNFIMLLSKPEMRDLRAQMFALSEDVEAYRLKQEEAQEKN